MPSVTFPEIIYWVEQGILLILVIFVWYLYRLNRSQSTPLITKAFIWLVVIQFFFLLLNGPVSWLTNGHGRLSRYFLPPYNDFLLNRTWRQTQTLLAGWIATAVVFLLIWFFRRRQKGVERVNVADMFWFIFPSAAIGWPGILVFFASIFCLAIVGFLWLIVTKKKSLRDRLVLTPYIFPAAVLTLLFEHFILNWTHLGKISF